MLPVFRIFLVVLLYVSEATQSKLGQAFWRELAG